MLCRQKCNVDQNRLLGKTAVVLQTDSPHSVCFRRDLLDEKSVKVPAILRAVVTNDWCVMQSVHILFGRIDIEVLTYLESE